MRKIVPKMRRTMTGNSITLWPSVPTFKKHCNNLATKGSDFL